MVQLVREFDEGQSHQKRCRYESVACLGQAAYSELKGESDRYETEVVLPKIEIISNFLNIPSQ